MNYLKLSLPIILLLMIISCNKKESEEPVKNNIELTEINKQISVSQKDSIQGACTHIKFELKENRAENIEALLKMNDLDLLCDGTNEILASNNSKYVKDLKQNELISNEGNWTSASNLDLQELVGKDEIFIGYRSLLFPEGKNYYYYGWIKVKLEEDKKTLVIYSMGMNYVKNKSVRAGQTN